MIKDGGCPHMRCHICQFDFCWTCGLSRRHLVHYLGIKTGETSMLCGLINKITHSKGTSENMIVRNLFCRYLFTFIAGLIVPPIMYCLAAAAFACFYPFSPIYITYINGWYARLRCINKALVLLPYMIMCYIGVALAGALVGTCATIALVLYYPFFLIIMLLMTCRYCCNTGKKQYSEDEINKIEMHLN